MKKSAALCCAKRKTKPLVPRPDHLWVIQLRRFNVALVVRIYSSLEDMRRSCILNLGLSGKESEYHKDSLGICASGVIKTNVNGKWKATNAIGILYLHADSIGAGYVAHEIQHAIFGMMHRDRLFGKVEAGRSARGTSRVDGTEERLCDICGELTRLFWNRYHRYVATKNK